MAIATPTQMAFFIVPAAKLSLTRFPGVAISGQSSADTPTRVCRYHSCFSECPQGGNLGDKWGGSSSIGRTAEAHPHRRGRRELPLGDPPIAGERVRRRSDGRGGG